MFEELASYLVGKNQTSSSTAPGSTAFAQALDTDDTLFDYLSKNPKLEMVFAHLDDDGHSYDEVVVVDIGGGIGHDINAFQRKHRLASGRLVLQDLEKVVEQAKVESNITIMPHDFFKIQTAKGRATYGRNYQPYDLPVENLTHVFYAFANISSEDGKVSLSDPEADTDKHFASDSWAEPTTNLHGCLKQLFLLKKKNRKLKTLLSIGGSKYSNDIGSVLATENGRQNFAQTAVALLADLGFDGLDIDWEYPQNELDAESYVASLRIVRAELDDLASKLPQSPRFLLTVASSCGPSHYSQLRLNEMDHYVDFWNLMAYDFTGSWTTVTGHQTNIFPSKNNTASTPFDAEAAVDYYTESAGIKSQKIVLGMPLYGRIFAETAGPGSSYVGFGDTYDWEAGIWDYKV
ncbi:family 18 glycoside hydrolase, partial [Aureobasidium melanogenum]